MPEGEGGLARVARWMTDIGGLLVALAAAVICAEIVLRRVFNTTMVGVDEIGGYALAIGSAWSFAHALIHKAHVRIDTLYFRLPRRLRPYLDLCSLTVLLWLVALLTYRAAEMAYFSGQYGSRSMTPIATPLVVPQALWAVGLGFFLLVIVVLLARALAALLRGDGAAVSRLAGPATIEEELEDELGDVARRAGERSD